MRTIFYAMVLCAMLSTFALGQEKVEVKFGGKTITIPVPKGYVAAKKESEEFKSFQKNFSGKMKFLALLTPKGKASDDWKRYYVVAGAYEFQNTKCTAKDFPRVKKEIIQTLSKNRTFRKFKKEAIKDAKAILAENGIKSVDIEKMNNDIVQGDNFLATVIGLSFLGANNQTVLMTCGINFCRTNDRIINLYSYQMGQNTQAAKWTLNSCIALGNEIIKANPSESKIYADNTAYNIGYEFGFFIGIAILVGIPVGLILLIVWIIRKIIRRSKKVPVTEYIDNSMNIPPLPPIPNEMFSDKTNGNE